MMQQILSPNYWPDRGPSNTARWIIVHGTAGFETAQQVAQFFASQASGVSAHYVIGRDGTVIQCVLEASAAWANGGVTGTPLAGMAFTGVGDGVHRDTWWSTAINPNLVTMSVEHVKPSTDNSDELTVEQATSSFALIESICTRWSIPRRAADANGGITGHFSMDPVNRSHCPGPYPWAQLWQYLAGDTTPQGWSDDGTTLTAPNGVPVVQGFRQFVLANQWDPTNLPLEAEHAQSPLELSNPALGGGTQQVFRWTILEWTAQRGVFVAWSGVELLYLRAQLAKKPPTPAKIDEDALVIVEATQTGLKA